MTYTSVDPSYQGNPPWEISRPQPAVVALAEDGGFAGRVLDVGCGTGENALYLASRGHRVLGVDGAATAIERAPAKAQQRDLPAEFVVADAFALAALGQSFDTVLDSAFMHIPGNTAARRRACTDQLAAVLPVGGWVHLLEISEQVPQIRPASYAITTGEVPAWLASVQRR